jgi:hypothetical protein
MNTMSSSGSFIWMTGICLDRLLKQRLALRKPDSALGFSAATPRIRRLVAHTEVTKASRRGTERSIGVNAIAGFAHQVDPNLPGPDPNVFLCDLMFVLSGLCDEIGLRNLGLRSLSVAADCLATKSRALSELLS